MSIVNFDCLKVTTMTVIVKMIGSVLIDNTFPLLNITRLDLPPPLKPTKKYKIPYCGKPGAILAAKFRNVTRGIVKSKGKRSFLNSITIDICTSKKNINAKLSGNIIQMCGPDSEELSRETAQHIIDHLLNLQKELDYINSDKEKQETTIEWLKNNSIGKDYVIDSDTQEIIEMKPGEYIEEGILMTEDGIPKLKEVEKIFDGWHEGDIVTEDKIISDKDGNPYTIILAKGNKQVAVLDSNFFIKTETEGRDRIVYNYVDVNGDQIKILDNIPVQVMEVKSIFIPKEYPDKYPEDIDPVIANFYIKYAPDFAYHHVYCQFLDSVKDIDAIATEDLAIDSINMAMVNYSYSLGMCVDRWKLANSIDGMNRFTARYNNATDHSVTISLPYDSQDEDGTIRRKKEGRHTFMVHKSGIVTQSGRNIKMMRRAYYLFMATLAQIRHVIIQENKPFNLKYRPVTVNRPIQVQQMITC